MQPAFARCNLLPDTAPTVALKGSVAGFTGYRHCRRPLDPGCWLLAAGWSWWVVAYENGMELMEEIIMELMEEIDLKIMEEPAMGWGQIPHWIGVPHP